MSGDTMRTELRQHLAAAEGLAALVDPLTAFADELCRAFAAGGRMYTFGNGGSAADAQHFAAELVGRYLRERRPLPAVALSVDPSVVTCIANDYAYEDVFARQVEALAGAGDVVVGFTTSGRSPNVVRGLRRAQECRATTALFARGDGSDARAYADHALLAAAETTARTQEMHLLMLHLVSEAVDAWAAGERTVGGVH